MTIELSRDLKDRFYRWSRRRAGMRLIGSPVIELHYETGEALLFSIKDLDGPRFNFKVSQITDGEFFSADWDGNCNTDYFCFWIKEVRDKYPETLEAILDACVKEYTNIKYILSAKTPEESEESEEKNMYYDEELGEYYDAEELGEYNDDDLEEYNDDEKSDEDDFAYKRALMEKTSLIQRKSPKDLMYRTISDYDKKYQITVLGDRTITIEIPFDNTACKFKIVFGKTSDECPKISIISPRFELVKEIPIRISGMVVIKDLTPFTWNSETSDIVQYLVKLCKSLPEPIARIYHKELFNIDYIALGPSKYKNPSKQVTIKVDERNFESSSVSVSSDLLDFITQGRGHSSLEIVANIRTYCNISNKVVNQQNTIMISSNVARNIFVKNGDKVLISAANLPVIGNIVFRDINDSFDISVGDQIAKYKCLTVGEVIRVDRYDLIVEELFDEDNYPIHEGTIVTELARDKNVEYSVLDSFEDTDPLSRKYIEYSEEEEESD